MFFPLFYRKIFLIFSNFLFFLPNQILLNHQTEKAVTDIGIALEKNNVLVIKEPAPKKVEPPPPPPLPKTAPKVSPVKKEKVKENGTAKQNGKQNGKLNGKIGKMNDTDTDTEMRNADKPIMIETENGVSDDDYDLALGASASPTEPMSSSYTLALPSSSGLPAICDAPASSSISDENVSSSYKFNLSTMMKKNDFAPDPIHFNGLVNQAMTCYLNSLLQALFMTPEFRNALYKWEHDSTGGESKSIPFQLQKLFLRLQTNKGAVETTELTKSFGWDSSEAWQQHDVQELCRVMFDALEQKFKNTKQADLINHLYEGRMIDYVKCLECSTEKQREDKFLDIPLPLRQFGSTVAYESVEEAIKAFVQPETLDGNNQYFCERCNKKCDAHKGLKFSRFPYILTLHLKRFDFDYQTFHRIKLNDRVTFPQTLNLNGFVSSGAGGTGPSDAMSLGQESVESAIKFDDCSTTDSGSALEEDAVQFNHQNNVSMTEESQEDDEGIDMSVNGDCKSLMSNSTSTDSATSGPYLYDLFSIMIHSGSASGGHYYAYIRDFESGKWYSFNDQTVTTITMEDIAKSFGGGSFKGYYSGHYSSSTNAYMLMYRQNDPRRNCLAMKADEFPAHINDLLKKLNDREENERKQRERETDMLKLKVYYKNRKTQATAETKVFIMSDSTLKETLESAYYKLQVKVGVPMSRCRLVGYENSTDNIECSFEGKDNEKIGTIMDSLKNNTELLLETRGEEEEFEVYEPHGNMTKVYIINLHTLDIDGPMDVRALDNDTVLAYKQKIARKINVGQENLMLSLKQFAADPPKFLMHDTELLKDVGFNNGVKVYVGVLTAFSDCAPNFMKVVERFDNLITLYLLLPNNKKDTLETMSIPTYDPLLAPVRSGTPTSLDQVDATAFDSNNNSSCNLSKKVPSSECNSEDSSLSDSDRTLVDDLSIMSTSNSPIFSPDDVLLNLQKSYFKATFLYDDGSKCSNSGSIDSGNEDDAVGSSTDGHQKILRVLADKDMVIGKLKESLQLYVKVPMDYFKIFRMSSNQTETECTKLSESLTNTFKDAERVSIELGRALRKDEFKCKLYHLNLSEITDDTEKIPFVCEYILRNGAEVGQTKREILAHLVQVDKKFERLTYERTRLRKKNWKCPTKIYFDDQKFGDDILLSSTSTASNEIIVQELPGDALLDNDGQKIDDFSIAIFVRQFFPSKMEMSNFEEAVIGSEYFLESRLFKGQNFIKFSLNFQEKEKSKIYCQNCLEFQRKILRMLR